LTQILNWNACRFGDYASNICGRQLVFDHHVFAFDFFTSVLGRKFGFESRDFRVSKSRCPFIFSFPLSNFKSSVGFLDLPLDVLDLLDSALLFFPDCHHPLLLFRFAPDKLIDQSQTVSGISVALILKGFPLDLESRDFAIEILQIDRFGLETSFHPMLAAVQDNIPVTRHTSWDNFNADAASSNRSIALSGKNRSLMYLSEYTAAWTSAASEI
jgi:hypothetical protein